MIKYKDVMEKLDAYLETVTLKQLDADLKKAGFDFEAHKKQMEWDCINYECGDNDKKQPNRCGKINILLSSCDDYKPFIAKKDAVADVPCNDGLELERLKEENNILWAILHTCVGCKRAVRGWMYGCEIQKHINLTGICNQREEF